MAKSVKLRVSPTAGNPTVPMNGDFDIRDRLIELIGGGHSLDATNKAAIYGDLSNMVGKDAAEKIMTHAYLFNTRPEIQRLPVEQKIKSFFDIGSNDPTVQQIINKSKNLGTGVLSGYRNSISELNQRIAGRIPGAPPLPEVQNSISNRDRSDLDIRDRISELIGSGNKLDARNRVAIYNDLNNILGPTKAQKLITHISAFNQRPEVQDTSTEAKLRSFYDIGASDPEIQNVITKSKSLGYGVVPGFRSSISDLNQKIGEADAAKTTPKIMLRVNK